MSGKTFGLTALLILLLSLSPVAFSQDIKIGVLAPRGELKATVRWQEFGNYLSDKLGSAVTIVPLPPARVIDAASQGKVDYLLSHSPHTVYAQEKLGATILATLNTVAGPRFGGVIVVKKGSGITKAEDLRGKNAMSLKFNAAAGAYIFQTYHLLQKGIDPHKDFASIKQGKKQDDLVLAVKNGLIDAAFVRTGLLENMQREGKIKLDEFQVVDSVHSDDFPLLRTTALYPEWCFSALPTARDDQTAQLKTALFQLKPDMPAAKKARIVGFVEPVELDGIKKALKALKIAPYN
jgi:ABC-type phosphate/phosphonate transport system substrate-binding protein